MNTLTQRQTVEVEIYTICATQTIMSTEGDVSEWSFLATDLGNVWFKSNKTLDPAIVRGAVTSITVYKYKAGTHNSRTGRKNKNFNVYLDNSHLSY